MATRYRIRFDHLVTIVLVVGISHESMSPQDWVAAGLAVIAIVLFRMNSER